MKLQNPPVFRLPTSLPPCLPAVRPTSGGRIGPIFSHNTEYRLANTDLLFRLRFIHCALVTLFILPCLPFSLTGERKGEKSLRRGVDKLYSFYLLRHANGQMHVCLIASSVKIIAIKIIAIKRIAAVYGFKSPGWFDVETCMHVLGL